MYVVAVESPPASPSAGTVNTTSSSCASNLLPPGARSDDARFASSLCRVVQETAEALDGDGINTTIATGIFGRGGRRLDNGRLMTVFLLVHFTIGSGILNMPQTFRDSGLAATTVLYFVVCLAIWFGLVVLIRAAEALSSEHGEGGGGGGGGTSLDDLEYTELARRTLGKYGPAVVDGVLVLQMAGAVCSYVVLIGGLVTSLIAECTGRATSVWWQSFYFVTPMTFLLFVLPVCLVRHFSNLRWLAALSLFTIVSVVGLVVVGSPFYAADERLSDTVPVGLHAPLLGWDWKGLFAKIGSVMFAVNFAAAALHSYSGMGTRTVKEWGAAAGISVFMSAFLCYCTGIAGYLGFRSATAGNILDNFSGPVAACFKVLVVVHLILHTPSHVVILRHHMYALVGRDVMVASFFSVSVVTIGAMVAMVGGMVALVLAGMTQGDLFGYVLDVTGGITVSLTGFILPALLYLQTTKGLADRDDIKGNNIAAFRTGCKALFVFGCAVMVIVPIAVTLNIKRE